MEKIKELLRDELPNCEVPLINYGGCGIFALRLFRMLDRLGIPCDIISFADDDIEDIFEEISNGNSPSCGCNHVVIQIDDYYYDSDGEHELGYKDSPYHEYELIELTAEQLQFLIDGARWNNTFDRQDVPLIDKFIVELEEKIKQVL